MPASIVVWRLFKGFKNNSEQKIFVRSDARAPWMNYFGSVLLICGWKNFHCCSRVSTTSSFLSALQSFREFEKKSNTIVMTLCFLRSALLRTANVPTCPFLVSRSLAPLRLKPLDLRSIYYGHLKYWSEDLMVIEFQRLFGS